VLRKGSVNAVGIVVVVFVVVVVVFVFIVVVEVFGIIEKIVVVFVVHHLSPGDRDPVAAILIIALAAAKGALTLCVFTSIIVLAKVTAHDTLRRSPPCL
jgi:hypothetical protein